jgi:carotenoid cleavage dioxygenase
MSIDKKMRTSAGAVALWTALVVTLVAVTMRLLLQDLNTLKRVDKVLTWFQGPNIERNPYLEGNFGPVAEEHRSVPLHVTEGTTPGDLSGLFVRNGPNPIREMVSKNHFWFDGHGMLHNVRFRSGTATYTNTYIPTPRYKIETDHGEEVFFKVGEMVGWAGLIKLLFVRERAYALAGTTALTSGQANTHVIMYQNKFYALHEASLPFEIKLTDDGSVEGVGYETFGGVLNYSVSAHPKVDFETGNLVFHSYSADPAFIKQDGPIKVGEVSSKTGKLQ